MAPSLEVGVTAFCFVYDDKFALNIMKIYPKLQQKSAFSAPLQKICTNKVP